MKRERTWLTMIVCLLALLPNSSYSLTQGDKPKVKRVAPDDSKFPTSATFKFFGSKYFGKVVKGAPYSATAITEHIQTLGDGNQIIRKNEAKVYRDGEGRIRFDQKLETIGKWAAAGDAPQMIYINDPVAGYSYNLDPHTRTAHKSTNVKAVDLKKKIELVEKARVIHDQEREKRVKEHMKRVEERQEQLKDKISAKEVMLRKESSSSDGRRKVEALGKQIVEGVEAEGTRSTLTIPAGEIGNTLPIEIVEETWYSADLQIQVMSKHSDPRSGVTTYRLTNINRSEPDRSLFEVPTDYTIVDEAGFKKMMNKLEPVKKPKEDL